MLCRRFDLFIEAIVAIDGSKLREVNNRDKNFAPAKMKRRLEQIDKSIARYLGRLDSADHEGPSIAVASSERLNKKIAALKEEIQRLNAIEAEMNEVPDKQLGSTQFPRAILRGLKLPAFPEANRGKVDFRHWSNSWCGNSQLFLEQFKVDAAVGLSGHARPPAPLASRGHALRHFQTPFHLRLMQAHESPAH
jgi:hypothetical protein